MLRNSSYSSLAFVLMLALTGVFLGCTPKDNPSEEIALLEARVQSYQEQGDAEARELRKQAELELAQALIKEVDDRSESQEAPVKLFKAAQLLAKNDMDPSHALRLFEQLIRQFPDHPLAGDALYQKGSMLYQILNNPDGALDAYERFVRDFPEHELVPSARSEIEKLGTLSAPNTPQGVDTLRPVKASPLVKEN